MKKLLSSIVLVAMLLSTLAIVPFAYESEYGDLESYSWTWSYGDVYTNEAGDRLVDVFTQVKIVTKEDWEFSKVIYISYYVMYDETEVVPYNPSGPKNFRDDIEIVGMGGTCTPTCDDGMIAVDIPQLNAVTAGVEAVYSIKHTLKIIAEPGETITLTDDDSDFGCATYDVDLYLAHETGSNTLTMTVPEISEEPTHNAPAALGGQVKTTNPAGLRLGFSIADLGEEYTDLKILVKKADGEWKTVNVTKFYNTESTQFTVCITNIPDNAKDVEFTAKAVVTFADGTTTESAAITRSYNGITSAIDANWN